MNDATVRGRGLQCHPEGTWRKGQARKRPLVGSEAGRKKGTGRREGQPLQTPGIHPGLVRWPRQEWQLAFAWGGLLAHVSVSDQPLR